MVEMVKTRTIPYHPITNDLTERLNSTIISMIQKAVSEEEYDWDGHLSKLLRQVLTIVRAGVAKIP